MKILTLFGLVILLSGCSIDTFRVRAASGFDSVLEGAERVTCNDTSIGSILRRYGKSAEQFNRWREYCFGDGMPFIEIQSD